jgi:hypothetical protein
MNKYASGYTAIGLISVVGWLVIAVSLIGGIVIFSNANRGEAYIGFAVAIAGAVQGLLLLGVGAIGSAILDGSTAQQEVADHFGNVKLNSPGVNVNQSAPINRSAPVDWMTIKPLPPLKD